MSFMARGTASGLDLTLDPPRRNPPKRIIVHLPQNRPVLKMPAGVEVVKRTGQSRRWDYAAVIEAYRNLRRRRPSQFQVWSVCRSPPPSTSPNAGCSL